MKLSPEQHAAFIKVAGYFNRIEEIAQRMGLDVDALPEEFLPQNERFKKNLKVLTTVRKDVFKNKTGNPLPDINSILNLDVIINEERFAN